MNERIRLFAKDFLFHEQFTSYGESIKEDRYEFFPDELQAFVEFIVAECMNVALDRKEWVENQVVFDPQDQAWNRARVQQSQHIVDKIKEHFGVE